MNEESGGDKSEAVDALFWRAEILQALYWMRGEGLASEAGPQDLAGFLAADPVTIARELGRLAIEGFLDVELSRENDPRYRLSPTGVEEGGRAFHDEFADVTHPAHWECCEDCWCHDPDHAGEPCPLHTKAHSGNSTT